MSFGPDFDLKERVRQATDLVELVGRYLTLRRQGRNFVGLCPFHDDRKPSLQVSPDRQTWKCWVCDVGGDVFSFLMQREGIDFREALEMLADRAGISLASSAAAHKVAPGSPEDKSFLYKAMQWAADQYHRCLLNDPESAIARDYLASRDIEPPTSERFHLGYAPDQWSWLVDRARTTPYTPEVLAACGLVEQKQETGRYYDRFRGRVLFPIRDTQQRVIALGGRVLPEAAKEFEAKFGRSPAKYINSPETRIYTKSDHLYGLDVVRDAVADSKHIVIVEGYTDVVLTWQAGITNVAAVLGTALNERHLRLIKRFADRVTLVLDGDEAGQKRTNEVLDLFIAAELDLRVLTLPEGLDPCDFVARFGVGEFERLIDRATDALDHKIASETRGIDTIHETHRATQALERILQTIAKAPRLEIRTLSASCLREQAILAKLSRRFHLQEAVLRERLDELRRGQSHLGNDSTSGTVQRREAWLNDAERHELDLLEIAIAQPEKIDLIVQNISPDQFVLGPLRDLYETICHCYHLGMDPNFSTVMTHLEDARAKSLMVAIDERVQSKLASGSIDFDRWTADVIQAFQRMDDDHVRRRLLDDLGNRTLSEEEESAALDRIFQQKLAEQQQKAR